MFSYTINSYSIMAGYNLFKYGNIKLISGIGLRYNHGILGWFDEYSKSLDGQVCHEYSRFGPVLLNELNVKAYKNFSIGILSRYNPMINKYAYQYVGKDLPCFNKHSHDRFNYLSNQLILKYTF